MIIKMAYCSECGARWQAEGDFDYRCPECDSRSVDIKMINRAPTIMPGFHIEEK